MLFLAAGSCTAWEMQRETVSSAEVEGRLKFPQNKCAGLYCQKYMQCSGGMPLMEQKFIFMETSCCLINEKTLLIHGLWNEAGVDKS